MNTRPLTDAESVVTNAEFADFASLDVTDTLIPIMTATATAALIDALGIEFITRSRKVIHKSWPMIGTDTSPSLSPNDSFIIDCIELPYSHTAATVASVLVYGEADTPTLVEGKPFALVFDTAYQMSSTINAIEVEYSTGFGTIDDVPQSIKSAVMVLASFLYDHRGACDMMDAVKQSGAMMLVSQYKTELLLI